MKIIKFPNGEKKEFKEGTSFKDIALSISENFANEVITAKFNDKLYDLTDKLKEDGNIIFITKRDQESLAILRHTTAHIFAQALSRLYPKVKLAIGPSIEHGFYYDFDLDEEITEKELPLIEKEMHRIITENLPIQKIYKTKEEAFQFYKNNPYKTELLNDIITKQRSEEKFSFYKQGEFEDLCRGPHLKRTSLIKAFKLDKVTKAYWKGDSRNKQIYRIYGFVFWKQKELNEYLEFLEEAKKRDHRIIGKNMDLFSISDYAPGMPFFHNRGMIIWDELMNFWFKEHRKEGYDLIRTPIMLNKELWEISGHWNYYKENMYISKVDDVEYAIKPMNCPGGILVYKNRVHSYKELPIKSGEIGLVHRHELSGTLTGLFRVRCFHQDDAHIFMREDQIKDQILGVLNLVDKIYKVFGLKYYFEFSTRPEKSIGSDESWTKSETGLKEALEEFGKGYRLNKGDGAFYGPKIDIHLKDAIGRTHQCGTIQLDMNLPERFNLYYINEKDEKIRPVMIHRVIYGSFERFLGILIEHFAGKFPLWLSPVQIKIINVADRHIEYSKKLQQILSAEGFRVESNFNNDSVSKKIALSRELDKPNYTIVIGDNELKTDILTIRTRKFLNGKNETLKLNLHEFITLLKEEIKNKAIKD